MQLSCCQLTAVHRKVYVAYNYYSYKNTPVKLDFAHDACFA